MPRVRQATAVLVIKQAFFFFFALPLGCLLFAGIHCPRHMDIKNKTNKSIVCITGRAEGAGVGFLRVHRPVSFRTERFEVGENS